MKTSACLASAVALVLPAIGGEQPPAKQKASAKPAKQVATSAEKNKPAKYEYVQVTGSHIRYRVKAGEGRKSVPLNLTVVDPKETANQGYSNPLDMLLRNPSVSRGYRGY